MEFTQLSISMETNLVKSFENIIGNIGLDTQSAIRMFVKRVINDSNINFLILGHTNSENSENKNIHQEMVEENIEDKSLTNSFYSRRSNDKITIEMRNYLWTVFKQCKQKKCKSDTQTTIRIISEKTGMNSGSVFIYLNLLESWIVGKDNTRTMKFDDLVFYVNAIKQEFEPAIFNLTLKALQDSIPYWKEKLRGRFGEKVEQFIMQCKRGTI